MPKKARLPSTIHDYNFKRLSKIEKNHRAKVRLLAMAHVQEGV
jgi:hypothetical protein